jgi:Neisseria PilC beta-propeller domain
MRPHKPSSYGARCPATAHRASWYVRRRRAAGALVCLIASLYWTATASAQLDPLLFAKRVPPTVIIVLDTSLQMLEDGNGNFYDPNVYSSTADAAVMSAFPNITPATQPFYQRTYRNLAYEISPGRYTASTIVASPATGVAATDAAFLNPTRWAIARQGIAAAVGENAGITYRWGLVRLRQRTPAWRTSPACDQPVRVTDLSQTLFSDTTPCNTGVLGKYGIYAPSVAQASYAQTTIPPGTVMVTPNANTAASIVTIMNRGVGDNAGIVPAGLGDVGYNDRPIDYALIDARNAAVAAMTADTAANRPCRNTVVVLITSGKDDGNAAYNAAHNPATTAATFLSVTASGVTRRIPIHVLAINPAAADEAELQSIATSSAGRYQKVTHAAEITRSINYAVQQGFARSSDFDSSKASEYLPVSPIVGTVNLVNAKDSIGNSLPNTEITADPGGQDLPQRSNVLITAGFSLPGFDGRLRAFRAYKPETDSTKPSGWKFVGDNTKLWRDLDGRPTLAGLARTPADPNSRNIYTYVPDGSGGGSVVAFTTANAATLTAHMGVGANTSSLISYIRSLPLGAIIGSTPALMDPPSLDPAPDTDYGRSDAPGSFAADHKDRRSIIFFGANDGMIHAVDARTGFEVWAFIPYNLLPKLRTLGDGQPVEQFDYFVDSSPKLAEVKINGDWRSILLIGQGSGGTFYQAFDVTKAGIGVPPESDDLTAVNSLLSEFDTPNESIAFKWAFPNYSSFDPTYTAVFTVSDGTPGGKVKIYGDVKASAAYAEKTVGFTWSDPAVGPLNYDRSTNAVIVGSGYFPDIESLIPNRGASAPKAGNAMYLLDVDTGKLVGNPSGSACGGPGCLIVGDVASNGRKNALQADPTAAGDNGSFTVNKAFLGDIDGKYWRFNFTETGTISKTQMIDTAQAIYGSSALLFVGSTDVYMFFATGSDILPSSAPGGTGTFKLYGLKNGASSASIMFSQNLTALTNLAGLATGERPSTAPSVAGDIVFFTTTNEVATTPCNDFTTNLYAVTYAGGAAYDSNANGKIDKTESTIAKTLAGRATAPFIVDQHLYVATTGGGSVAGGANIEKFGDPEDYNNGVGQVGVRILSWREIR